MVPGPGGCHLRPGSFRCLPGWVCGCRPVTPSPRPPPQPVPQAHSLACPCVRTSSGPGPMPQDMPPRLPVPHPDPGPLSPPAPQPHIPFSSLSPSPSFLLSHGTSPWHAATAGAGELHGPQKSQAVRQSRRAARLCLANTPLMSFQKTKGGGKRHSFKSSVSPSSSKIFLPNETWAGGPWGELITLPLARGF